MSEGYILCCFGEESYFKLADRMITNIRNYDKTRQICILTDDIIYFSKYDDTIISILFDYRNHIHPILDLSSTWNKYGFIPKIYQIQYTPFDRTMFFDVDMIFKKDITHFWDIWRDSRLPLLIPGVSDHTNMSPPDWHWGGIRNVSEKVGVPIPQVSSTIIMYDKSIQSDISLISNIIDSASQFRIKMLFRGGIPDEIIYSIYMGLKKIHPNQYLFDWIINVSNCDCCNKTI